MADEEIKNDESKDKESASGKNGLVGWVITFVVAVVCAVGGFGLSGLFAKAAPPKIDEEVEAKKAESEAYANPNPEGASPWIYELDSNAYTLNEPGGTRMVQFAVILEISGDMDEILGKEFLVKKKIYLQDWLGTYMAGLNLQQVSGSASQSRFKVEIMENCNEIIFPDSKPLVNRVMLKGFIIQ